MDTSTGSIQERFTASPGKLVRFVNEKGQVIKEMHLNRKQRRGLQARARHGR